MKYITILLTLFLMKSCGNSKDIAITNEENTKITTEQLTGTYTIILLENEESISTKLSLVFDESSNKVKGFAGCNNFFGTFNTEGETITFSELASTKKMCPEKNMNSEMFVMNALSEVNSYSLENNILNLKKETSNLIRAKKVQDKIKITYETSTRGFFEIIWISQDSISFSKDRSLKVLETSNCPKKEWNGLLQLLQNIDIKSLEKLEAPSKKFQYDGAVMATLKIESEGNDYTTNIFDHGNPPEEIKELVNKILSMKKISIKE